jgi:hypothetical protein
MLYDTLRDRLNQRIVGNGLHENRAIVVPLRCRYVHRESQGALFLQQPVVDVFN